MSTLDVLTSGERAQLDAFLDEYRQRVDDSLDGLTDDQARRRLVPSRTTVLGLVKHLTFVERIWFGEVIARTPRAELGLPESPEDSFTVTDADTVDAVRAAYRAACADSRAAAAGRSLDDVVTGHRFGPMTLRWIHLHCLREFAQHVGHAEILREQILAAAGPPR